MGRRFGDRRDGRLIRDIDAMHVIMPMIYPNRCDNEAFIAERIDLTAIEAYLEKKNADGPEYAYNLFQIMVAAMLKVITLRPKMNRFIANKNLYQRNEVSAAFVIKKAFSDHGEEALAFLHAKGSDTLESIHEEIGRQVRSGRSEKKDSSSESMEFLNKLPRPILKAALACCRFLDRHGWMIQSMIETDPFYSSVVLTNLGSIRLHAGYHHLTNWGTCSVFCAVGERKKRPFYDEEGNVSMRMSLDLGLTIDERIADGYYYAKTVRLLRTLLEHPALLERPLDEPVEY